MIMPLRNKISYLYNSTQNLKDLITKKSDSQKIIKNEFLLKATNLDFCKNKRFEFDWVQLEEAYLWTIRLENFQIDYLPKFEYFIVTKTNVIYEDLELSSNCYFVLENKTNNNQTILLNLSIKTNYPIFAKPIILYHSNLIKENQNSSNIGYTFQEILS